MEKLTVFSDTYFMQQALKEAAKAELEGEVPVGAVVVCNNTIIARAHNQTEQLQDVTAHAEMLAITAAANHFGAKYLNECTLYVTLEPCSMCAGALYHAQFAKVVWAAGDPKGGFQRFGNLLHPKTEIQKALLENESSELLKRFFRQKR
ncbi:MAG: nucleoside deaminase [Bacteroidales bacterium]|jgi:tRNA(adenine34) deaminase|nr:nucleoside deaminase [Bacteroidales bacterium]HOI32031.1 nucleoside deaminase [Bacteroidales bacterium]